jgi:hypothetical protein
VHYILFYGPRRTNGILLVFAARTEAVQRRAFGGPPVARGFEMMILLLAAK